MGQKRGNWSPLFWASPLQMPRVGALQPKGGEDMSKALLAAMAVVIGLSVGAVSFVQADEKAPGSPAAEKKADKAEKKAEKKMEKK